MAIEDGVGDGSVVLGVVSDEKSELTERFQLILTGADGGADIDTVHQTSSFSIRCVLALLMFEYTVKC